MTSSGKDNMNATSSELSDQALDWIVRLHSGSADPRDTQKWQAWRAISPAHEAAALEAEHLWNGLGTAGASWGREMRNRRMTRRSVLGGGAAVVVAGGMNGLGILGTHLFADYQTATAERQSFELEDGTEVLLNARTALSGAFENGERGVSLTRGQAFFTIVQNNTAPFHVSEGKTTITCAQGEIDVDLCNGRVGLIVHKGAADVSSQTGTRHLAAGQHIQITREGRFSDIKTVDLTEASAWRRGKLIFNRRPLGDLAVELERYRGGRIVVMEDELATMEITGVFDLADPDAILDALEAALPVRISKIPMLAVIRTT
ncbi:FecR family protein [Celeribacter sp. ULVN23_4]